MSKPALSETTSTFAGKMSFADVARTPKAIPKQATQRTPHNIPASKPAIIVSTKGEARDKQEVISAWKRSINFKSMSYGPSRVLPVSRNKLRVEFDDVQHRDETLNRLENSSEVTAEPTKKLLPMLIVKGVSKDISPDELTGVIKTQNPTISLCCRNEEDLKLRFTRINKKSSLYNAVYLASPPVWRAAIALGHFNVDCQRVHVDEFSPFLQCFNCLQFGHTRAKCGNQEVICSHCSCVGHSAASCRSINNSQLVKCYNCTQHNNRFEKKNPTNHSATSNVCPRIKTMRQRLTAKIDYDGY